jgi:L-iduronidase
MTETCINEDVTEVSMRIDVDIAQSLGSLKHFWQSTGFTPANLLLNADMQQAIAYLGGVPHGGITFVRIHYLLELVRAEGLGTEHPTYDWSRLDTALDVLVRNGLKPFFELMGNIEGFFDDYTKPAQADAWRRLVEALAQHLIARYGSEEVRSWKFETWNEPDVGFWKQSDEAFCIYYDACHAGLKAADRILELGGPGTCRNLSRTLKTFLAHCDADVNTLTGETGIRPAFISVHEKGVRSHPEDLTPDTNGIIERERNVIRYIREQHPVLADLPFINNECDPQVGWGTIHTWRARPYYAALVTKILNQHLTRLVDGEPGGVDYSLLSNDNGFLGAWGHRTHFARFGEIDDIDHGQADGFRDAPRFEEDPRRRKFELIKKPVFNVMSLLSLLGSERCAATLGDQESADEPIGVLATRRGRTQVAVLLYHSTDAIMRSGNKPITLHLNNLPFERAMLAHYRIAEGRGDPFLTWESMGAPANPTSEHYAELREHQELAMLTPPREVQIEDSGLRLTFDLPLPGVSLVLLSADPFEAPARVSKLRAERYEGMSDAYENVMLTWKGLDSRMIRTYEILAAFEPQGPYTRINVEDQIDSAFLHVREPGVRYYRVRAVDYWGREGGVSETLDVE